MVLVTGATGHLGANLVRALLLRGDRVRVLLRESRLGLDGLEVEPAAGDVTDPKSLPAAMAGIDVVYHLAGYISITGSQGGKVEAINVGGARNVAEAALAAGVRRMVHTSSIHAFAHGVGTLDETSPRPGPHHPAYDRSKAAGEAEVRAVVARGLDAVIVNPTGVIGPQDYRPSRVGQSLIDMAEGRIPVVLSGGFDWVDVRDVTTGMLAAVQRGRTGENYLLGGRWGAIAELGRLAAEWAGRSPPRVALPTWLVKAIAPFAERAARIAGREPTLTAEAVFALETGGHVVSHQKATTELGHQPRPLEETVRDTLDFFRSTGRLR